MPQLVILLLLNIAIAAFHMIMAILSSHMRRGGLPMILVNSLACIIWTLSAAIRIIALIESN